MATLALLYSLCTQLLSLFFGSVPLPSILSLDSFLQETRCECQCKSGRAKRRTEEARCRCFFVQSILNKAYRCSKCKKVYETSLHITNGTKNVRNTKIAKKSQKNLFLAHIMGIWNVFPTFSQWIYETTSTSFPKDRKP